VDKRIPIKIVRITQENPNTKTFCFSHSLRIKPGQFIMITDYETNEKPLSVSWSKQYYFAVTVKRVGEFTNRLFQMNEEDVLYFRGPYGKSFSVDNMNNKKILIVAGGCGTAPMRYLASYLKSISCDITVINGAKTKDEIIFLKDYDYMGLKTITCTDDGTIGQKGTTVDIMSELLKKEQFDMIYASGPELMLKGVLNKVINIDTPCEFLLERYMKCGVGICGQCTVDPTGIRLCVDGPVLGKEKLKELTEFASYTRDASGQRVYF